MTLIGLGAILNLVSLESCIIRSQDDMSQFRKLAKGQPGMNSISDRLLCYKDLCIMNNLVPRSHPQRSRLTDLAPSKMVGRGAVDVHLRMLVGEVAASAAGCPWGNRTFH